MVLQFVPESHFQGHAFTWPPPDDLPWRDVAPRPASSFAAGHETKTLAPTKECDAFSLDLRDHFTMPGAGTYRLKLVFAADCVLGGGESRNVEFQVTAAGER